MRDREDARCRRVPEDFVAMKLFAGGPQDLSDAKLVAAADEHLGIELIGRRVRSYGPDAVRNYKDPFPSS
jgi:hypothetical protein